jgi:hypothetical protein
MAMPKASANLLSEGLGCDTRDPLRQEAITATALNSRASGFVQSQNRFSQTSSALTAGGSRMTMFAPIKGSSSPVTYEELPQRLFEERLEDLARELMTVARYCAAPSSAASGARPK